VLRLELRPSVLLAIALVAAHLAAAVSAYAVMPGPAGAALAVALAALGALAAWSRALLRSRHSVRVIEVAEGTLTLQLASGDSFAAERPQWRYVSRWLVILPLLRPRRRSVLVTADMLDADSFRRLRVWALWGRVPVAPAPPPATRTALH
jgi:hypothetical protein